MTPQQTPEFLQRALRENFGLASFRPGQLDAALATLSGADSLVILPTGGGKSVCFQLPCMTREYGFTVVVCPLIALAKDQVDKCDERGIYAERWNCEVAEARKASIARDMASDEPSLRLLYTTPESLRHPKLLESLKEACGKGNLVSFAIDEAHTVSEWGHDFRPAYLELCCIKQEFPSVPVTALTASCTGKVKDDIISVLRLRSPVVIQGSFNRPNIAYEVRHRELIGDGSDAAVVEDLISFIEARRDECGIIYARLRGTCDWLASALAARDVDVGCYHAGRGTDARTRVQRDWSNGGLNVVVATIAFGMGIDRADVRWVVHWNTPTSMEGFYQESGRGGRDGQPSLSIMYASHADLQANHKMERGTRAGAVAEVASYAHGAGCRRRNVLKFFGEQRGPCDPSCDQLCDVCTDPAAVRRALSRLEKHEAEQGSKAAAVRARMMGIRVATNDGEEGKACDDTGEDAQPQPASSAAWSRASTYGMAQPTRGACIEAVSASDPPDAGLPEQPSSRPTNEVSGAGSGGIAKRPLMFKRPLSATGPNIERPGPGTTGSCSKGPAAAGTADAAAGGSLLQPAQRSPHDEVGAVNIPGGGLTTAENSCLGGPAAAHADEAAPPLVRQPLLKRPRPGVSLPFKAPARVQSLGAHGAGSTVADSAAADGAGLPAQSMTSGLASANSAVDVGHSEMRAVTPPESCGAVAHESLSSLPCQLQPGAECAAEDAVQGGATVPTVHASTSASGVTVTCKGVGKISQAAAVKRRTAFKPPLRVNAA